MNRVFRSLWNRALNAWVAVPETASAAGGCASTPRRIAAPRLTILALALVSALVAQAGTTLYWDPNGNTAGLGGTGTWDTASVFWNTSATGAGGTVSAWNNANLDLAVFGGTAGTVTLSGSLDVSGITFSTGGYTLTGGTLNLVGATPTVTGGGTINSAIAGTTGFRTGGGNVTLTLGGANTFTGPLIVAHGSASPGFLPNLTLAAGASLATSDVTVGSGAAGSYAVLTNGSDNQMTSAVVSFNTNGSNWAYWWLQGTSQSVLGVSDSTGAGVIEEGGGGNSTLALTGSGTYSFNGVMRGGFTGPTTFSLVKSGSGTQTLSGGGISYNGTTTVSGGRLVLNNTANYRSATTVNGVTLELAGNANLDHPAGFSLALNNGSTLTKTNTGYDTFNSSNVAISGTVAVNITNNGTNNQLFIGGAGTGLTGSGTINLTNTGSATTGMTLRTGAGSFSGAINVSGGVLNVGSGAALALQNSALSLSNSARLNLGAAFATTASDASVQTLSGDSTTTAVLGAQTLTLGTNNGSGATFSGVISGTGGLAKTGTGTQTLSGTNTYTGATAVNAGTLQAGAAAGGQAFGSNSAVTLANASGVTLDLNSFSQTIGSLAGGGATGGNVSLLGGTLTTGGNNTSTSYAGVISGIGGLTKNGSGTQTLSGTSTYVGATTVNAGSLRAGAAAGGQAFGNGSAVTLANVAGATLDLNGFSQTVGSLAGGGTTGGNVTLGTATLTTGNTTSASYGGVISGSGGLTKVGSGTQTLTGSSTYTGATTINAGTLAAGAAAGGQAFGLNSAVTLADVAGATLSLSSFSQTIGSLSGGGTTGGNVTLVGGGILSTGGLNTSASYAGVISGNGGLTKQGSGTQTVSGISTYTGATTINAGVLQAGAAAGGQAFGVNSAVTLANVTGAKLDLNGFNQTIGSLHGGGTTGGNVSLGTATLTTGGNGVTGIYSGVISGSGGLTRVGSGTQVLQGISTYTGATTVNGGTLQAGAGSNGQAFGLNSAMTIANVANAVLNLGSTNQTIGSLSGGGAIGGQVNLTTGTLTTGGDNTSTSFAGVIAGTGGLTKVGTGTQTLSGTNSYTGATTINAGTLQAGAAAGGRAFGNLSAVTLANTAGVTLDLNGFDQSIRSLAGGGAIGGNVTMGAGTLTLNNNASTTYSGVISGSGGLIKAGTSIQILSGTSTFTGTTTINAGILRAGAVAGGQAFGVNSAVTLANVAGASLDLNGFSQTIGSLAGGGSIGGNVTLGSAAILTTGLDNTSTNYAGAVSGTGSIWKQGSGVQTLSGINTHTGGDRIYAGTLRAGSTQAFGATTGRVELYTNSAVLDLNGFNQTLNYLLGIGVPGSQVLLGSATLTLSTSGSSGFFSGVISGSGGITKAGAGRHDLLGSNTYTGATTINAGTLRAVGSNTGGQAFGNLSAVTIANVAGATLDLNGTAQIIGSLNGGGTTGGAVALGAGALTTGGNNASTSFAGVINGSGGLTKNGTGTQTLTGDSTYIGTTTINTGTLQLGNGGATGSIVGDIVNNAALVFNRANTLNYAGAISGAGTISQIGSGTTRLTGDSSSFSGTTSVTGGALRVNGTLGNAASAVNVSNGGTLGGSGTIGGNVTIADGTLDPGNSPGTLTIDGDLNLSSASVLNYELGQAGTAGGALNDHTIVGGNLTLDGTLNVSESAGGTYGPGVYRLISYAGSLTDNGLTLGSMPAGSSNYLQTSVAHQANLVNTAGYTLNFWDGANTTQRNNAVIDGGNGTWQASTGNDNWTESTGTANAPYTNGSFAIFSGTAGTVSVDNSQGAVTSAGMQFTTSGYVIQGQPITLAAGSNTLRVGDGTAASAGYTATIAAELAGTGGIDKTDLGTLVLSGTNSYTGGTTVSAGTLQLGDGGTTGSVVGDITNNATLAFNRSDNTSFAGAISGFGNLVKLGANTLTLTNTNSYTGSTSVNAGTLQAGSTQAFGVNSAVTLANTAGATLDLNNFDQTIGSLAGGGAAGGNVTLGSATLSTGNDNTSTTYAGVISGSGGLTKNGTGTQTLSGVNLYTGPTTINAGTLQAGAAANGQAFGSNSAVTLADAAGVALDLNGFHQTIGSLSGGGSTGGNVTLGTGTLTTGTDNTSTSFAGSISGSGGLIKKGSGLQALLAANGYTGATTINAGILQAGAAAGGQAFGNNSAVALANVAGATLDLNGFDQTIGSLAGGGSTGGNVTLGTATLTTGGDNTSTSYAGVISGSGGLIKKGSGMQALLAANGYTGATIIEAGILQAGAAAGGQAFGNNSAVTLADVAGAALDLNGFDQTIGSLAGGGSTGGNVTLGAGKLATGADNTSTSYAGTISGSGGLAKTGSGTQTLTGDSSIGGTTAVNAGTLQLGNGGSSGSLGNGAVTLTAGATLALDRSDTLTLANAVSGAGTLAQIGTGTSQLTSTASVGATTITNGTLDVSGSLATPTITMDAQSAAGAMMHVSGTVNAGAGVATVISGNGSSNPHAVKVLAGGTLTANTGAGDLGSGGNTLDVAGTLDTVGGTFNLGAGNDTFTLHDGATVNGTVDGGAGTNTLNTDINTSANLGASVNFQTLNKAGVGTLNITGPQASTFDTVNVQAGTVNVGAAGSITNVQSTTVAAGATLKVTGSYSGGVDNDLLDVAGTLDLGTGTLNLGAGNDTFTLHDGATVIGTVDGGAGTNTLNTDINTSANLGASVNFQTLLKTGTGTLNITGPGTSAFNTVLLQGGALQIAAGATVDPQTTVVGSGTNFIVNGSYTGTAGNDTMDVSGTVSGTGTINLLAGDDVLTLRDGAVLNNTNPIDGGAHSAGDAVVLDNAGALNVDGAQLVNFELLRKQNAGTATLTGAHAYSGGTEVQAGTLDVTGSLTTPTILMNATSAAGATLQVSGTVEAAGATPVVIAGSGSNPHTVSVLVGGTLRANTGAGDLGSGGNTLDVAGTLDAGGGVFNLGAGNDTFTLHDGATVLGTVDGGAGTNTLNTDINTSANLGASVNFQTLLKTGTGILNITGPAGSAFNTVDVQAGTLDVQAAGSFSGVQTTTVAAGTTLKVDGAYTGSAGNDAMTVSGTVSGSGTIGLGAGDDTLTLRDGAVLANSNPIDGGAHSAGDTVVLDNAQALSVDGSKLVNWEFLRKQNVGTAALTGTNTYSGGTDIQGGTLNVAGTLTTPTITMDAQTAAGATLQVSGTVNGGAGVATVITGSGSNPHTVSILAGATLLANTGAGDLGSGGNTLDVAGTLDTVGGVFNLGSGNDNFIVHDNTVVNGTVDGGAGIDSRVYDINGTANLGALVNFEALVKKGTGQLDVNGPAATTGLQLVDVQAGTLNVTAGASITGVQTTQVAAGATLKVSGSYTGSAGNDLLDVAGTLDLGTGTLNLGAGNDTFTLRDGATVIGTVDGGTGTNTLNTAINTSANLGASVNFQTLLKTGTGVLNVNGPQVSVFDTVNVQAGTVNVAAAGSLTNVQSTTVAAGATLKVDGSYTGSAGNDTMTVSGTVSGTGTIDLGNGDDTLTLNDGASLTGTPISGGGHVAGDCVVLNNAVAMTLDAAQVSNFELLTKTNTGVATLTGTQAYSGGTDIQGGTLNVSGTLNTPTVAMAGATLQVGGTVNGGAGVATVITGSGGTPNTVSVLAGATLLANTGAGDLGSGGNTLDVAGTLDTGGGTFNLGAGNDTFTLHDGATVLGTVDGGAGTNTLNTDINGTASLGGSVNFQSLSKTGTGTLNVTGPQGSIFSTVNVQAGTVNVAAAGSLTGVQATTVASGATLNVNGSYTGSAGNDTMTVAGTVSGAGTIGLGAGDDTLTLRDGAVLANTNPIDGGTHSVGGGDTVVLNNAQALSFDGSKVVNFENLTKQGSGVATLTGSNSFAGTTTVQAGTLRAGGTNVLSAVGAHVVASGATLDLAGWSQTVASLTNSGTVSLVGSKSGTTLTVTGNYHGNNGVLRLGVDQSNTASPADQLVLSGPTATATGKTLIDVVNVGVLGTATQGDGIELIAARNGATTTAQTTKDAFALVGGHVDGGAFQYRLYAADASGNGESWYLRSDAPNNPGKPAFRPEVSLFAGAPEQMRQGSLVMLSNLHQRSGDVQGGAKSTEELAGGGRRMWGRAIGSDIQLRQAGDVGQVSDGSINGMQLGLDLYADASWHAGLYAGRLTANAKVNGMAGGEWTQVGSSKMRGGYLGGYATWIGSEGTYVDTVLQLGHHGYTLSPKDNPQVSGKGKNLLASVEAGQAFRLNGQWDLEPQLQLTYAKLDIDDVEISSATVQQRSVNGWQARLGLRLKGSFATENGMLKPYARLNLNVAPNGKDGTRFVGPAAGAAEVSSSRGQQAVELAGGFTWEASRTVSVYGEVGKLLAVGGDSRVNSGVQASLGLRVNW